MSEENKRLEKLLKDSSFLNKQIERLIYELNTLGDGLYSSNELVLAETQLKYMKLHANALNLRIAEIKGEME